MAAENGSHWQHALLEASASSIRLMQYDWKTNLTEQFKKLNTEPFVAEWKLWEMVWFHYWG